MTGVVTAQTAMSQMSSGASDEIKRPILTNR